MISAMKDLIDMDALRKIDKVIYMTGENEYWQFVLNGWHREFLDESDHVPMFTGFKDLGSTTRGRTWFYIRGGKRYGAIEISNRLKSDWRIKATLWHEFCHHWEWVETGKHGHGKGFDARVRRKPVLWVLCAISRCLPT